MKRRQVASQRFLSLMRRERIDRAERATIAPAIKREAEMVLHHSPCKRCAHAKKRSRCDG
ncbi:protein of unknown function [Ralstonia solanacearum CMR15]|nr:protein of unknown function [Ralstonia solanacearum CMR15]